MILHYSDAIMSAIASQITSLAIVYSTVYSGPDQIKYQTSASLAFVSRIYRWPVNSPHKGLVTRKMFPFDDVVMCSFCVVMNIIRCYVNYHVQPNISKRHIMRASKTTCLYGVAITYIFYFYKIMFVQINNQCISVCFMEYRSKIHTDSRAS